MRITWLGICSQYALINRASRLTPSRASMQGARIIMQQVSPESEKIFDLIVELSRYCNGRWRELALKTQVDEDNMQYFLEYCATFLDSLGNYRV